MEGLKKFNIIVRQSTVCHHIMEALKKFNILE